MLNTTARPFVCNCNIRYFGIGGHQMPYSAVIFALCHQIKTYEHFPYPN